MIKGLYLLNLTPFRNILNSIKFVFPKVKLHNYHIMNQGQYGQPYGVEDILKKHKLWKKIKKRKQPGFFIEAGASGGEHLSNSLYFEIKHNWTGLLAEPSPDFHEQLLNKNR